MPETAELRCSIPDVYRGLALKELARSLGRRVSSLVRAARRSMKEEARTFLGAKAVLKQAPSKRAFTEEPRRRLNPRVAGETTSARVKALVRLKVFWREYREAWQRWACGEHDAIFPAGTYQMRHQYGARCARLHPPAAPAV